MVKKYFLILMIVLNLVVGSTLGYLLTTLPSAEIPDEFVDLALKEQAELGAINSDILAKQLADFEAEVLASAQLIEEILINRSQIPLLPYYYHDRTTISRFGISQFPPGMFYSELYDGLISLAGSAYQFSPDAINEDYRETYLTEDEPSLNPHLQVSQDLIDEMILTSKIDHLWPNLYQSSSENIWLYFTSEKGYTRSYPYSNLPKDWDGRDGSWYQSAETGAKDIIILFDKSGSMEGERREGAVNATRNIISGLGGRDRFNLVTFSDRIRTFSDSLSLASEENLVAVNKFINSTIYGGTTDFDLAFETGFELLKEYGNARSTPVVIFITDGAPTIGIKDNNTIIEKIVQQNGAVDAEMVLFGIGNDTDQQLLSQIADATEGTYIQINNSELIEPSISQFKDFLSINQRASLTWSLPRTDVRGQGLVLTSSYPIIINSQQRGVVAVDISVDSMKNFTKELEVTSGSYSFIFDLAGNNIIHPSVQFNFSNPITERQTIAELENDSPEFLEMIQQAEVDQATTRIIEYNEGAPERVVSLNPIGNTSMVFGLVSSLKTLVPEDVLTELDELSINQFSFIPGIGLGVLGSFIMLWQRARILREEGDQ